MLEVSDTLFKLCNIEAMLSMLSGVHQLSLVSSLLWLEMECNVAATLTNSAYKVSLLTMVYLHPLIYHHLTLGRIASHPCGSYAK